jgi:hypothetical protein
VHQHVHRGEHERHRAHGLVAVGRAALGELDELLAHGSHPLRERGQQLERRMSSA